MDVDAHVVDAITVINHLGWDGRSWRATRGAVISRCTCWLGTRTVSPQAWSSTRSARSATAGWRSSAPEMDRRVPAAGKARLAELNAQEERDGSLPTDLALEQLALYWPAYFPEPESAGASPMPLEASTESAAVMADARVDVVGGAGHFIWLDVPGAVRRSLDALAQRAL